MPRIGILVVGSSDFFLRVFRQGLHDLGYVEGQNLTVEVRPGGGNLDALPALAKELVCPGIAAANGKTDCGLNGGRDRQHSAALGSEVLPDIDRPSLAGADAHDRH